MFGYSSNIIVFAFILFMTAPPARSQPLFVSLGFCPSSSAKPCFQLESCVVSEELDPEDLLGFAPRIIQVDSITQAKGTCALYVLGHIAFRDEKLQVDDPYGALESSTVEERMQIGQAIPRWENIFQSHNKSYLIRWWLILTKEQGRARAQWVRLFAKSLSLNCPQRDSDRKNLIKPLSSNSEVELVSGILTNGLANELKELKYLTPGHCYGFCGDYSYYVRNYLKQNEIEVVEHVAAVGNLGTHLTLRYKQRIIIDPTAFQFIFDESARGILVGTFADWKTYLKRVFPNIFLYNKKMETVFDELYGVRADLE